MLRDTHWHVENEHIGDIDEAYEKGNFEDEGQLEVSAKYKVHYLSIK